MRPTKAPLHLASVLTTSGEKTRRQRLSEDKADSADRPTFESNTSHTRINMDVQQRIRGLRDGHGHGHDPHKEFHPRSSVGNFIQSFIAGGSHVVRFNSGGFSGSDDESGSAHASEESDEKDESLSDSEANPGNTSQESFIFRSKEREMEKKDDKKVSLEVDKGTYSEKPQQGAENTTPHDSDSPSQERYDRGPRTFILGDFDQALGSTMMQACLEEEETIVNLITLASRSAPPLLLGRTHSSSSISSTSSSSSSCESSNTMRSKRQTKSAPKIQLTGGLTQDIHAYCPPSLGVSSETTQQSTPIDDFIDRTPHNQERNGLFAHTDRSRSVSMDLHERTNFEGFADEPRIDPVTEAERGMYEQIEALQWSNADLQHRHDLSNKERDAFEHVQFQLQEDYRQQLADTKKELSQVRDELLTLKKKEQAQRLELEESEKTIERNTKLAESTKLNSDSLKETIRELRVQKERLLHILKKTQDEVQVLTVRLVTVDARSQRMTKELDQHNHIKEELVAEIDKNAAMTQELHQLTAQKEKLKEELSEHLSNESDQDNLSDRGYRSTCPSPSSVGSIDGSPSRSLMEELAGVDPGFTSDHSIPSSNQSGDENEGQDFQQVAHTQDLIESEGDSVRDHQKDEQEETAQNDSTLAYHRPKAGHTSKGSDSTAREDELQEPSQGAEAAKTSKMPVSSQYHTESEKDTASGSHQDPEDLSVEQFALPAQSILLMRTTFRGIEACAVPPQDDDGSPRTFNNHNMEAVEVGTQSQSPTDPLDSPSSTPRIVSEDGEELPSHDPSASFSFFNFTTPPHQMRTSPSYQEAEAILRQILDVLLHQEDKFMRYFSHIQRNLQQHQEVLHQQLDHTWQLLITQQNLRHDLDEFQRIYESHERPDCNDFSCQCSSIRKDKRRGVLQRSCALICCTAFVFTVSFMGLSTALLADMLTCPRGLLSTFELVYHADVIHPVDSLSMVFGLLWYLGHRLTWETLDLSWVIPT